MKIEDFLHETQTEMENYNIEIRLNNNDTHVELPHGMRCNGYFADQPKLIFAVGTKKPLEEWLQIYIHEYCHFTQWRDKIHIWDAVWIDGMYYDDFMDLWLGQHTKFPLQKIELFLKAAIDLESDCERRSYDLIKKNGLPIDRDIYAQKANSYIHFYNYIKIHEKWYIEGKEPYNLPKVYSQFNTTIDDDFSISWEYLDLYEKHCF